MPYRTTPSIGQLHGNSCWAACLTWFLKVMPDGRPAWNQQEIIQEYIRSTDSDGALMDDALVKAWNNDSRIRMRTVIFDTPYERLEELPLGNKPVCIAFKHSTGFAHMNVIWRSDPGYVHCMEPYWPFPGVNGKRTGRFVRRAFEHFNYGNAVVLAWARPSDGRPSLMPVDAD